MQCADGYWNQWFSLTVVIFSVLSQTVASEASPVQQMWHRHVRMCGLVFRMVRGMRGEVTGATSWSVLLFPWASRARRSRSSRKATTFTRRWSRCCLLHQSISRTSSFSSSNGFWYTNSLVLDFADCACYTSPLYVPHLSPVLMVSGAPTHWLWTCWLCLLHQSTLCTSSLSSSNGFWYTNSLVLDLLIVPVTPVHFMYLISLQF